MLDRQRRTSCPKRGNSFVIFRTQAHADQSFATLPRADFTTLTEALDYAAQGETGRISTPAAAAFTAPSALPGMRQQAIELAGKLLGLGLEPGSRVALVAETNPDFCFSMPASTLACCPWPCRPPSRWAHTWPTWPSCSACWRRATPPLR